MNITIKTTLIGMAMALTVASCDSSYGHFLNNVPIKDERAEATAPTQVFLGVDGISRQAFDQARAQGAFRNWNAADWVGFFPAVSDYSWMRMFRAGQMPGYELQYFDPKTNELHNKGLLGVAEHPLSQGLLDPLACWKKFDFLGNGEAWTFNGYLDPEAALPGTTDDLFRVLERLGRTQEVSLAYLMNVDVVSHTGGLTKAVAMLIEIDRRINEFQASHPGRFTFTMFGDHGNAHVKAELVDPRILLEESGVPSVERLFEWPRLEAIAIVHVRVNFVSLHTHPSQAEDVAKRTSMHRWVDLTAVDLGAATMAAQEVHRYGVFKKGHLLAFAKRANGDYIVERPDEWDAMLGTHLALPCTTDAEPKCREQPITLGDRESFERTHNDAYPDPFHRIETGFSDKTVQFPPQVMISMPDNVSSFGFHLPGGGDHASIDGFHGALTRGSSLSVLASQSTMLPPALRADDLLDTFPALRTHLERKN